MKKIHLHTILEVIAVGIGSIVLIVPIVLMLKRSLEHGGFDNYLSFFSYANIGRNLLNSFLVVGSTLIITVTICSLAAYAFSKLQFAGSNILFIILMLALMIPGSATLYPVFRMSKLLNLTNKAVGLIGPYVTGNAILGLLLLKIFYDELPNELMDASKIDGANSFQVFAKIYFPMSMPGLSVLLINTFNGSWNELMTCITLINDQSQLTMAAVPYKYQLYVMGNSVGYVPWPKVFACLVVCMIPIVIFYLPAQRLIVNGVSAGAVKG